MGSQAADLPRLKISIFEAISSRPGVPSCKLWALYRNGLRLFLLGSLAKCELDAIVCYTLGKENVHLHNELVQALLQNVSRPKAPLLARVAPFVDEAIKREESRQLDGSVEGDEEEESETEEDRQEAHEFYEQLRRKLSRGGPVWDVRHYLRFAPPATSVRLPEDPAALALSLSKSKANQSSNAPPTAIRGPVAGSVGPSAPSTEAGGGLKRKEAPPLDLVSPPSHMRRVGEAMGTVAGTGDSPQVKQEGSEADGWETGGLLPPACLPSLPLVHHALRSAWQQQPPRPNMPFAAEDQQVSMQATHLLNNAVQDFTRRVLRRCVHVAKAERSRAASVGAARASAAAGAGANGGAGAAQQQQQTAAAVAVIGPSTVLRALRVPSADQKDPIGRSFPPPSLLEDMYCLSFY